MPPFATTRWDEIAPGLYMGGHDYLNADERRICNVVVADEFDLVLSLYSRHGCGPADGVQRRYLDIHDGNGLTDSDLARVRELADLGAQALRDGRRVLVRCQAGYNRSGLLTAFILMRHAYAPDQAVDLIRQKRSPWALCNATFVDLINAEAAWLVSMAGWVGLARDVATEAHTGQVDKAGKPYIDHPAAVAKALEPYGPHAEMAGWLHDVVEDTDVTLDRLRQMGFPEIVVEAVDSVSRRPGETYMDMIRRAARHPLGRKVKMADNRHNFGRLDHLPDGDREFLSTRYERAYEYLVTADIAEEDYGDG